MAGLLSVLLHVPELRRPGVNLWALDLHAHQPSLHAVLLDLRERLLSDEIRLLVQIHEPAQAHYVRVVLGRHVGAVVQDAPLDPPNLRGRDRADVVLLAGFHDPVPEFHAAAAVRQIYLVAHLRGPTGPRDHDGDAADLRVHEVIVPEIEDRGPD